MLAATAALVGGGAALAPVPAAAMLHQETEAECLANGGWWESRYGGACITFEGGGGGSGGSGSGSDSGGGLFPDGWAFDGGGGGGVDDDEDEDPLFPDDWEYADNGEESPYEQWIREDSEADDRYEEALKAAEERLERERTEARRRRELRETEEMEKAAEEEAKAPGKSVKPRSVDSHVSKQKPKKKRRGGRLKTRS